MSIPRYAARRDQSEPGIVAGLNALGWDCVRLSGGELPDLLCRHRSTGKYELLETESGHYKRRRSPEQTEMLKRWNIPIVKTLDEAIRALGAKVP